jgi:hypothetical protein
MNTTLNVELNSIMDCKLREEFNDVVWEDLIIGHYGIVDAEYIPCCTNIVFKSDKYKTFFLLKYS